jgi:hypothetical protein
MLSRCLIVVFTVSMLSTLSTGCSEPPACDQLVTRLCAAAGEVACTRLKAKSLTDQASCRAVLDDASVLSAQLDALVAATAARALSPPKLAPVTGVEPAAPAPAE